MITITRQFALQLRNLLRRMGLQSRSARLSAPVLFLASAEGLHVRAVNGSCALEYHQLGPLPPAQFALPVEALAACEGSRETPVTLETSAEGRVSLRWEDREMPVVRLYDDCRERVQESWPRLPQRFSTNDHTLVTALQAAANVVDHVPTPRFAIDTVQLQGQGVKVVATDCRQALVIRGDFKFPWDDDVLMVPTDAFGFPEFPKDVPVEIGTTETHVFVRIRPWTLYLARVKDRRYPDVEGACPLRARVRTRVHIPAADRDFLARSLRRLPAREKSDAPVTVDCNGHLAIRAQVAGETPLTELVLSRSQVTGEPVRFHTNREYLEQGVSLGFGELLIVDANSPCIFEDDRRTYFWMVLNAEDALGPSADCVRMDSAAITTTDPREIVNIPGHVPNSPDERLSKMVRASSRNGNENQDQNQNQSGAGNGRAQEATNGQAHRASVQNSAARSADAQHEETMETALVDPITAAEALQVDLRTALASTSRLLQLLRRNRKQARLVESTLASLRQLQSVP